MSSEELQKEERPAFENVHCRHGFELTILPREPISFISTAVKPHPSDVWKHVSQQHTPFLLKTVVLLHYRRLQMELFAKVQKVRREDVFSSASNAAAPSQKEGSELINGSPRMTFYQNICKRLFCCHSSAESSSPRSRHALLLIHAFTALQNFTTITFVF